MLAPFDIFRCESEDTMMWVSSANDFETAKAKIRELMKETPSDYLIFSLTTRNKIRFKKGDVIV
jgi:hypothetical protein